MPLTAVGKIFKPDLRLDAIRHCVRNVAARLDEGRTHEVEVRETSGTIAVVLAVPDPSMGGVADNMRRELERYTFRVEIKTSHAPIGDHLAAQNSGHVSGTVKHWQYECAAALLLSSSIAFVAASFTFGKRSRGGNPGQLGNPLSARASAT
jgi:hypothetical protein